MTQARPPTSGKPHAARCGKYSSPATETALCAERGTAPPADLLGCFRHRQKVFSALGRTWFPRCAGLPWRHSIHASRTDVLARRSSAGSVVHRMPVIGQSLSEVDSYMQTLRRRIDRGERSGQLTEKDVSRLGLMYGLIESARGKFQDDGRVSRDERRRLMDSLTALDQAVWGRMHDDEVGLADWDSEDGQWRRRQAWGSRMYLQPGGNGATYQGPQRGVLGTPGEPAFRRL